MIPDWQLPAGVDRGLWDYLHSRDMAQGYDAMMMTSPLAAYDVRFCAERFVPPGRVLDLGCGTGRLAHALPDAEYLGIDLSEEMLTVARRHESERLKFVLGNLLQLKEMLGCQAERNGNAPPPAEPSGFDDLLLGGGGVGDRAYDVAGFLPHSSPPPSEGEVDGRAKREQRVGGCGSNLPHSLVEPPFDHAACLFSTFGMIRGDGERRQFLRDVFDVLRPGGGFVLHVHNRRFYGLGLKRWGKQDITMPQAYGGAPLTLTHFTRTEARTLLTKTGFEIVEMEALNTRGPLPFHGVLPSLRAYGYLIFARKPTAA